VQAVNPHDDTPGASRTYDQLEDFPLHMKGSVAPNRTAMSSVRGNLRAAIGYTSHGCSLEVILAFRPQGQDEVGDFLGIIESGKFFLWWGENFATRTALNIIKIEYGLLH
jgi:hypothetical protein